MSVHINVAYPNVSEQGIEFVKRLQLSPEFYFTADNLDVIGDKEIAYLRDVVEQCGSELTVHAPFACLDLGSKEKSVSQKSLGIILRCLETASALGASIMVVHPGYGAQTKGKMLSDWVDNAKENIASLISNSEKTNVKIAFENIFDREPDSLKALLELANSDNAGICFDIGHCNLFSRLPIQEWLNVLGERIIECHVHDNDRTDDQHKAVGSGTADYATFSRWYKSLDKLKQPVLTLEHRSRSYVTESLAALKGLGI